MLIPAPRLEFYCHVKALAPLVDGSPDGVERLVRGLLHLWQRASYSSLAAGRAPYGSSSLLGEEAVRDFAAWLSEEPFNEAAYWLFECENGHKEGDSWLQNDPETTQLLGDECLQRPPRWRRMEPISYRATPAFYPHSEQFIVFAAGERDLLLMLQEGNEADLAGFASERFGLGVKPPSDAEIVEMMKKAGQTAKVSLYESMDGMRKTLAGTPMADELTKQLRVMIDDWKATPGLVPVKHEPPPWLTGQIVRRAEFGSRYDPLVLAVEHEANRRLSRHHYVRGGLRCCELMKSSSS